MAAPSIYLYLGPENGEKKEAVDAIRNSLKQKYPDMEEFLFVVSKEEDTVSGLSEALTNSGLFSDYTFVLVRLTPDTKVSSLQDLITWMEHPTEGVTLIITSDETRVAAALTKPVPKQNCRIFYEMFENRKPQWIRGFFREKGLRATDGAIELILTLVDNSTDELRIICSQLADYLQGATPPQDTVTDEAVDTYISFSQEVTTFTLFEHIAKGNLNGAILALHSFMDAEANKLPLLLATLSWQLRRLLSLTELLDAGLDMKSAFLEVKANGKSSAIVIPKDKTLYESAANRYTLQDCRAILATIAEWDKSVRSNPTDVHRTIGDTCLYQIIIKKGRKADKLLFSSLIAYPIEY